MEAAQVTGPYMCEEGVKMYWEVWKMCGGG